MNPHVPFFAGAVVAPAILVALAGASTMPDAGARPARRASSVAATPAQAVIPTEPGGSIRDSVGLDPTRMYYDEPG